MPGTETPPISRPASGESGNERTIVETVLSILTLVGHLKKMMHRVWDYFPAGLTFTLAAFNILAQWDGLKPMSTAMSIYPYTV